MRILAILGSFLLLLACQAPAPRGDVVLETTLSVGESVLLLEEALPLSRPLAVGDEDLLPSGRIGLARDLPWGYMITLDPTLTELERVMVLIHEYAHLLVFEQHLEEVSPHGEEWGRSYSRVFRAWAGAE